jgi:hypothetical protein
MVRNESKGFARAAMVALALVTFAVSAYGNSNPPVITDGSMLARIRKRGFLIARRFDGESSVKAGSLARSMS